MKSNKLLIALALCAAMQPGISFGSEMPQEPQSQSYWQQYAPQFMQDTRSVIAKKYEDTIGKWSTRNKLILLGAVLTTLGVGAYYRNEIMQMISSSIPAQKPELTGQQKIMQEYATAVTEAAKIEKELELKRKKFFKSLRSAKEEREVNLLFNKLPLADIRSNGLWLKANRNGIRGDELEAMYKEIRRGVGLTD